MAITSIDIDDDLLKEVKRITGARTKKEAVAASLTRTVQMHRQLELIEAAADPEIQDILSHMHEDADAGTAAIS
ncbi:antitoxin of type II TA system, VapB [Paramicrobacterium humi]|uniref:Antitoxin of type II TA system, VapB n=1 Tax=Paramicrobacterium humi TaxID=640635 RepID=A0A1H4NHZ1_9MICO|nr:type II toxin-antitoxin system VapB family antitoxin [Microbacterium humi]SEB94859.1 antitoxin of type II TA system, VapB [Microbacterium humi]